MRNKYLEDLGLKYEQYGLNWPYYDTEDRGEYWEEQRELYGFDSRETWSMGETFIEWLYSHCMMFKELASEVIDLSFHTITYESRTYTQAEVLDYIIKWTGEYLLATQGCDWEKQQEAAKHVQTACHLWAEMLFAMWW